MGFRSVWIAVSTALALTLAGCAAVRVTHLSQEATQHVKAADRQLAQTAGLITSTSDAYLAGEEIRTPSQHPAVLMHRFQWFSHVPVSLGDAAAAIEDQDGLTVDVSELRDTTGVSGGVVQVSNAPGKVDLFYSGPLYDELNAIASKTQSWWRFERGEIHFYRSVTKTFQLAEVPQKCQVQSTINTQNSALSNSSGGGAGGGMGGGGAGGSSSGGSGGGAGSSSGVNSNCTYTLNAWGEVQTNLQSLAASANILVDQAAGTVTVTGTPDEVTRVAHVIRAWNAVADQQVEVTMHIYDVQLSREDAYGATPTVKFQSLLSTDGWSIAGTPLPSTQTAAGTVGADIVSNKGVKLTGFDGSSVVVQALSSLGHVVDVFDHTVVTQNGHPAIFTNTNTLSYIYEVSSFTSANVGQSSSIVPGTLSTGVTSVVTPRIVDGAVHIGLSFGDNALLSLTSQSSGGQTIQTPDVATVATQQDAVLRPGQMLLLTGFKSQDGTSTLNGVVGGGVDARTNRTLVAILITARVL